MSSAPRRRSFVQDQWLNAADRAVAQQYLRAVKQHGRKAGEEVQATGRNYELAARHELQVLKREVWSAAEGYVERKPGNERSGVGELLHSLHPVFYTKPLVLKSHQAAASGRRGAISAGAGQTRQKSEVQSALEHVVDVGVAAGAIGGLYAASQHRGSRRVSEVAATTGLIAAADMGLVEAGRALERRRAARADEASLRTRSRSRARSTAAGSEPGWEMVPEMH
ncbi:hypothetical protein JCM10207_006697 [Rhodosporidiobolus poonsookiae]